MFLGYFLLTFSVALVLTPLVGALMFKLGVVDQPSKEGRKIHKKPVPYGGGIAIFLAFAAIVGILRYGGDFGGDVSDQQLVALLAGSLILLIGGFLDDKFTLAPRYQLIGPVLASVVVIALGIGPHVFTNPFGGMIDVSQWKVSFGMVGDYVLVADTIVLLWLMGMMFTTKFLDGLDGLVAGVVSIGAVILYAFSMQPQWYQPEIAQLSALFVGACVGFLVWNWRPAKMFLGEGGSLLCGFVLAVLAIMSGAKIAITLLVMVVPILDVGRVVIRRWQKGQPIWKGDNEHLHFKLLARGMKHTHAVLLFYAFSLSIGGASLFLSSHQKVAALFLVGFCMVLLGVWIAKTEALPEKKV